MKKAEQKCKIGIVKIKKSVENPMTLINARSAPYTLTSQKDACLENDSNDQPVHRPVTIVTTNVPSPIPPYDTPLSAAPTMSPSKLNQDDLFIKNVHISYCDLPPITTSLPAPHCIALMCDAEPLPLKAPNREAQEIIDAGGILGLKAPTNYINPYVLDIYEASPSPKYKK